MNFSSEIILNNAEYLGKGNDATIIGRGRGSTSFAALANGAFGHAKELDDEHKRSIVHLGVVVVPAALAAAESRHASGKELITAVVLGYEFAARIGIAVQSEKLLSKGYHPTGVIGVFGATAAASKILKLTLDAFKSAVGIAGSLASGLFEFVSDGSWTKRLHPGWAAHSGVIASFLANSGFTGPHSVIDGKFGFAKVYADCNKELNLVGNLGETFEILETSYKRHGCCSFIHPLIDAALEILNIEKIEIGNINKIQCKIFSEALPIVVNKWTNDKRVLSNVDAQFNAYFALASSIYKNGPLIEGFTDLEIKDPSIAMLAGKITIEKDIILDKLYPEFFPAQVKFVLKNGLEYYKEVKTNKGSPSWPMQPKEIHDKFKKLCSSKYHQKTD